jgi:hypothetical protein
VWKKVADELPDPDEDVLFINSDVHFTCPHTGFPVKSSVIFCYRDKHQGGHFRSYLDVTDRWYPTHWMYANDLVDLIKM